MAEIKTSVALGLFDGVHIGHRAVIQRAVSDAGKKLLPAVFTFDPATVGVKQGNALEYIYTAEYKEILIRKMGVYLVVSSDFSDIKDMTGEEFAGNILVKKMDAGHVVCGSDFRFGKGAACGINELLALGKKMGFTVTVADDVICGGEKVSSTSIRSLLKAGEAEKAARLLASPYAVYGEIVHGNHIGNTIGFPTANQNFAPGQLVPAYGVYRSAAMVGGNSYSALTDIGVKPTIKGKRLPLSETHFYSGNANVYGQMCTVFLERFIRPEMKFDGIESLKAQLQKDLASAKAADTHQT